MQIGVFFASQWDQTRLIHRLCSSFKVHYRESIESDPFDPVNLHNKVTANRYSFAFRTTVLKTTNGTLMFCDKARHVSPVALIVSYTGMPRVSRIDRSGKPYKCAH